MKILGFTLSQKASGVWQAVKRIDGKLYNCYIGGNTEDAEKKIRAFCAERGLDVDEIAKKDQAKNAAVNVSPSPELSSLQVEITGMRDQIANLQVRVSRLEAENEAMKAKVSTTERENMEPILQKANLEQAHVSQEMTTAPTAPTADLTNGGQGYEVAGWKLYQDSIGMWYANKHVSKKLLKVYIGRDVAQAEEKIKAWMERRGMVEA